MAEDTGMSGLLGAMASKVDFKMSFLKGVMDEYEDIKHVIEGVAKEKVSLQQEKEMLHQEREMLQHDKEMLQHEKHAIKDDLLASKNTLMKARDALVESTEEISRKNSDIEFLKKKLQESEAKNNRAEQQCGSVTEPIQPRGVQTRSMQKRKRPSGGLLGYGADENDHTSQLDDQSLSPWELLQYSEVHDGSMEKQKRLPERYLGNDVANPELTEECHRKDLVDNPTVGQTSHVLAREEDIEAVRDELIKVHEGSMEKLKRLPERYLGNDVDNPELAEECPGKDLADNPPVGPTSHVLVREEDIAAVRDELIKGFLEIDTGGRIIGIREMGGLNEKAFKVACLAKVPPEEVGAASYELYSLWKQQLGDLSWYPFKTVTVDGNHQEVVNVDDDKLQELKRAWGSGAHNAVVNALVEMKEYGRLSDRRISYEIWNFKEGRRATTRECVNYMSNQVKQLKVTKRRKTLRSSGRA